MTVEIRNYTNFNFNVFVCKSLDTGILFIDIFKGKHEVPKEHKEMGRIYKVGKNDYNQVPVYIIKSNEVIGIGDIESKEVED